jgi:DNA-binding transcriptional MerR regulator
MSTYRTGDVAKMLNVTRKTIANWTDVPELQPYLSERARGQGGRTASQRQFTMQDVFVLNTVRSNKTRMNKWSDITALLDDDSKIDRELPPSALLVETISPVEQMQALLVAQKDLEVARAHIEQLQAQLEAAQLDSKEAQKEIIRLNRQIAVLEYRLEQYEGSDDDD